jgi:hypothetical protein
LVYRPILNYAGVNAVFERGMEESQNRSAEGVVE